MVQLEACQDTLRVLREQSEQWDVKSAAVSRLVCALDQRQSQLTSVATVQEKALKDAVHDWRRFIEKVR